MAALPGARRYEVSDGTGWPGFSVLRVGERAKFDVQLLSQPDGTWSKQIRRRGTLTCCWDVKHSPNYQLYKVAFKDNSISYLLWGPE